MSEIRNWIEAILYGGGSHRRFTQDGPVLPDVWTKYLEEVLRKQPDERVAVLIEPHFDSNPALVASRMRERLGSRFDLTQTVYNRTVVSSWLTLEDLVLGVVPLTRWYADIAEGRERAADRKPKFDGLLPSVRQMWDDLLHADREGYSFPKLLAFVRVAGIIAYYRAFARNQGEPAAAREELQNAIDELRASDEDRCRAGRDRIAKMAVEGWLSFAQGKLPDPPAKSRGKKKEGSDSPIYAVNRNRQVLFALTHSVKTVKADAAKRLFEIDCKSVTWAIIDSGIDAMHPAFVNHAELDATDADSKKRPGLVGKLGDLGRLNVSRVVETYDFGYIEELLMGNESALPERYCWKDARLGKSALKEIATRVKRSRAIDWELLKPFLRIEHDADYAKSRPTDGHGTHVAGILGADWARDDDVRLPHDRVALRALQDRAHRAHRQPFDHRPERHHPALRRRRR